MTERPTSSSPREKFDHRSYAGSRPPKRLVLDLPILSPTFQPSDHRPTSPNIVTPADSIGRSPRLPTTPASPNDSSTFLTSLAAQERRVLELREELQKAEVDLSRLKKQWAQYEAGRKRSEVQNAEQLQPLSALRPAMVDGYAEGSTTPAGALRASLENDKDRPVVRKSTQRVFSGSRHTRALSLLSPGAVTKQAAQPRPFEVVLSPTVTTADIHSKQPSPSRSSAMSDGEQSVNFGRTYKQLAGRRSMPPRAKDVFVHSGKKMVSDLREGLWTLFEDMRQATVGEEGINGVESRTAGFERGNRRLPRRIQEAEQVQNGAKTSEWAIGETQKEAAANMARPRTGTPSRGAKRDSWFRKEFASEASSKKDNDAVAADGQSNPEADQSLLESDGSWSSWDPPTPQKQSHNHNAAGDDQTPSIKNGLPWSEVARR
jgi:Domain of unknown function (DUF4048)